LKSKLLYNRGRLIVRLALTILELKGSGAAMEAPKIPLLKTQSAIRTSLWPWMAAVTSKASTPTSASSFAARRTPFFRSTCKLVDPTLRVTLVVPAKSGLVGGPHTVRRLLSELHFTAPPVSIKKGRLRWVKMEDLLKTGASSWDVPGCSL